MSALGTNTKGKKTSEFAYSTYTDRNLHLNGEPVKTEFPQKKVLGEKGAKVSEMTLYYLVSHRVSNSIGLVGCRVRNSRSEAGEFWRLDEGTDVLQVWPIP
jgi:hypothetical protein